jgi:hypothetical protein
VIKNNGGPAFPSPRYFKGLGPDGMTLRDYFATKAMQSKLLCEFPRRLPESAQGKTVGEWIADQSYEMADAMLKAREKGGA